VSLKVSKKTPANLRKRLKRKVRISYKVKGSGERPRLAVFRSNKAMYVQIIDDVAGKTLACASTADKDLKGKAKNTLEGAKLLGAQIAKKASAAKIEAVVFDRAGYLYHGKIKALADGAREAGLKF
jgi:large subunit ribosomal protein L18